MENTFLGAVPTEFAQGSAPPLQPASSTLKDPQLGLSDKQIAQLINTQKKRLNARRAAVRNVWDECWALYRGQADFRHKEEWQSKVVLPKAWNSVKQATNAMMRLLRVADQPWTIEAANPDDTITQLRGQQIGDLLRLFMEKDDAYAALAEGLEVSFILGMGCWKVSWVLEERQKLQERVSQQVMLVGSRHHTGG